MSVVIPDDYGQLTVNMQDGSDGGLIVNVFGFHLVAAFDQAAHDALDTALGDAYEEQLSSAGAYLGSHALLGTASGVYTTSDSNAGARSGIQVGATCPPQVQKMVRKTTAFAGRANVGRTFIPELLEAEVGHDGVLTNGEVNRLQSFADDVLAAFETAPLDHMVILHSMPPNGPAPGPPVNVTQYLAQNKCATQRRRYQR